MAKRDLGPRAHGPKRSSPPSSSLAGAGLRGGGGRAACYGRRVRGGCDGGPALSAGCLPLAGDGWHWAWAWGPSPHAPPRVPLRARLSCWRSARADAPVLRSPLASRAPRLPSAARGVKGCWGIAAVGVLGTADRVLYLGCLVAEAAFSVGLSGDLQPPTLPTKDGQSCRIIGSARLRTLAPLGLGTCLSRRSLTTPTGSQRGRDGASL